MLSKFMNPFKVKEMNKDKESSHADRSHVGLRILITHTINSERKSNVVVKSALRSEQQNNSLQSSCFLKTCNLCKKKFNPDKDIYMYRGDQGFCSVKCRKRQIGLDEIRELETSKKHMVASYRHYCFNDAGNETRQILEELRLQPHKSKPISCNNQNHWAIVA